MNYDDKDRKIIAIIALMEDSDGALGPHFDAVQNGVE